ncbi:hypothetical protein GKZ28_14490 [Clostridium chromiireducens]|uniref:Uncharacterized protein n=1 Tax=Clostridium chromiireducens TaxID=225345 RepID=A0A964RNZ9_9CLOT|nr:hypothetical protein [Clostridium chromiireducens]MVX64903.1 hypothetical protein [Clostridium chromiireducens]
MMRDEFKFMVDEDIKDIEELIDNKKYTNEYYKEIVSRYHSYIDKFGEGLYSYFHESGFYDDVNGESLKHNLIVIKNKLIAFRAYGYSNNEQKPDTKITLSNSNSNINQINININFEDARKKVENMTSLSELEIQEILDKINYIEGIVKLDDRKTKKWESCKSVIRWIADKGVDVGTTLLPLLLKIN